MKIIKYTETDQYITFFINGVRNQDRLIKVVNLIKKICDGQNTYFTIYMVDGIHPEYQNEVGEYLNNLENFDILRKDKHAEFPKNLLSANGQFNRAEDIVNILPLIADYFLETTVLPSKLSYEDLLSLDENRIMKGPGYYIEEGFSDILFAFADSDDFLVCFNKEKYDEKVLIDLLIKNLTINIS